MNALQVLKDATEPKPVVAIIGGAVAGSEAAAACAARGAIPVVFEQGARPYGKIEDGLPRWHEKLRVKEYKKTIVPIGCNGCDLVYTGSLPIGKAGTIVYRIGDPIPYEALSDYHIDEDYAPFSAEAEYKHRDNFQGAVDLVMSRINDLLDPEYQFSDDLQSTGVRGTSRFM